MSRSVSPEHLTEIADQLRSIADRLAPPPKVRPSSASELRALRAALNEAGFCDQAARHAAVDSMLGRSVEHPNELTSADVADLLKLLGGSR